MASKRATAGDAEKVPRKRNRLDAQATLPTAPGEGASPRVMSDDLRGWGSRDYLRTEDGGGPNDPGCEWGFSTPAEGASPAPLPFPDVHVAVGPEAIDAALGADGKALRFVLALHDAATATRPVNVLAEASGDGWHLYNADAVDLAAQLPSNSVRLLVTSPPFSKVYCYSDSLCDMGNCADDAEFFRQYGYLIRESFRVMMPGGIAAIHCKDLVDYRGSAGRAGLRDFPGDIIRAHENCENRCANSHYGVDGPFCNLCGSAVTVGIGWKWHASIIVWKCPVLERARTNSHGLLYRTLRADSSLARTGLMERILVFRKWPVGDEIAEPVTHPRIGKDGSAAPADVDAFCDFSLPEWQQIASPVWVVVEPGPAADETEREELAAALAPYGADAVAAGLAALGNRHRLAIPRADIDVTDVLNVGMAQKNVRDEGHMCPLQLDIIERIIRLYSNDGDVVWDPFTGIGSTGVVALGMKVRTPSGGLRAAPRKFIGTELKKEYFALAARNIAAAEPNAAGSQRSLFDDA